LRRLAAALLLLVATGCPPKLTDLKKVETNEYFVLEKDYTRTQVRGLGYTWVEGLRAGRYAVYAEDDEGLFFMGQPGCVIQLNEDAAEEYLKTHQSKHGLDGGLWLPKPGVDAEPKLFFVWDPTGTPSAGVLIDAIVASGKGEVHFIGYGSEKAWVATVNVKGK
jgi:hypothetical protein